MVSKFYLVLPVIFHDRGQHSKGWLFLEDSSQITIVQDKLFILTFNFQKWMKNVTSS